MTIGSYISTFLLGMASCIGFCLLINIHRKSIFVAAAIGGLGWLTFEILMNSGSSKALAAFWGACVVTLISEFCSRKLKEAATVYIIPGILPLVPGAGLYYTMTEIINANYQQAATTANETFFVAGAIALAILIAGSFVRVFTALIKKITWS